MQAWVQHVCGGVQDIFSPVSLLIMRGQKLVISVCLNTINKQVIDLVSVCLKEINSPTFGVHVMQLSVQNLALREEMKASLSKHFIFHIKS